MLKIAGLLLATAIATRGIGKPDRDLVALRIRSMSPLHVTY